MRYSFRLAELLGHTPDPRRRPGTVKAIVEQTGLDRHQVAALLKNDMKYIPLDTLSKLASYLVEHGYASAEQLPAALFAIEPEDFWELLARRRRLELCIGVRRAQDAGWPEAAWVVAADSLLLGELLGGISTLSVRGSDEESSPKPKFLKQSLVWAPGQGNDEESVSRACEVYSDFEAVGADKALVCLGSVKSNPVVELMLANAFHCEPFRSQDDADSPRRRSCPFYLCYRPFDPHPISCCGGLRLSRHAELAHQAPGIYFEQQDGTWSHCPWEETGSDAAMVFYIYRESQGALEMALGGFSGRATRQLARLLADEPWHFWPPVYNGQGIQMGAFVVRCSFAKDSAKQHDILRTDPGEVTEVIRLHHDVIERRLLGAGK